MRRLHDHFPALCRLYAGGDALVSWYNSVSDPHSHLFRIARTYDGSVLLWLMAIVGALIVLDVLLNDWTPNRICFKRKCINVSWKRVFHHRHFLFAALAFCYLAQPYVAEMGGHGVSLLVYFYWHGAQNILIAFFDARQRSRSEVWQRAICS